MVEIHTSDGKLVATVHDEQAFLEWLDNFEELVTLYNQLQPINILKLANPTAFIVSEGVVDEAIDAAIRLSDLRKKFGDLRDDLYPTDIPPNNLIK